MAIGVQLDENKAAKQLNDQNTQTLQNDLIANTPNPIESGVAKTEAADDSASEAELDVQMKAHAEACAQAEAEVEKRRVALQQLGEAKRRRLEASNLTTAHQEGRAEATSLLQPVSAAPSPFVPAGAVMGGGTGQAVPP